MIFWVCHALQIFFLSWYPNYKWSEIEKNNSFSASYLNILIGHIILWKITY